MSMMESDKRCIAMHVEDIGGGRSGSGREAGGEIVMVGQGHAPAS
jgi:hypothetical protein